MINGKQMHSAVSLPPEVKRVRLSRFAQTVRLENTSRFPLTGKSIVVEVERHGQDVAEPTASPAAPSPGASPFSWPAAVTATPLARPGLMPSPSEAPAIVVTKVGMAAPHTCPVLHQPVDACT